MCDDIDATVEELRAKGAQFREGIEEREYCRLIKLHVIRARHDHHDHHKLAYNL
jgi:hypothetical protein